MLWRLENIILKLVCEKVVMRQSFPFPLTSTFRFRLSYYFRNFSAMGLSELQFRRS